MDIFTNPVIITVQKTKQNCTGINVQLIRNSWVFCEMFFFLPTSTSRHSSTTRRKISSLPLHKVRKSRALEVHGAVGQTVPAADVGNLLGLHGLQLGTIGDTMTQTAAERTASLSWEKKKQRRKQWWVSYCILRSSTRSELNSLQIYKSSATTKYTVRDTQNAQRSENKLMI